jgi:hypothetical protein
LPFAAAIDASLLAPYDRLGPAAVRDAGMTSSQGNVALARGSNAGKTLKPE